VSPQETPLALSQDGTRLYVANTTSGTLSVLDVSNPSAPSLVSEIKVGHDPVGVAVLPGSPGGDELVFVTNHISDSISVVSRNQLGVVQTLQEVDANGVSRTNEPVGVAFASATRGFVTLDDPNQVLVLDVDANGRASINATRLAITAQAPRALTVRGGRVYVAAAESGNQTELSMCAPGDDRPLDLGNPVDEGCDFRAEIIEGLSLTQGIQLGALFDFAARNPNIGGRVVFDSDIPDRDVFVFDAQTLALEAVIEHVGTLLNGVAVSSAGRVYVSNTEANNLRRGLREIDNEMFNNRLTRIDCGAGCAAPAIVDLDASASGLGQTVPTPYGIALSGDEQTLVLTASGADGDPGDGRRAMHGLFTLDADGNVLGSALVGALPEGVALRSGPSGAPQTAFVLNTAHSTLSVVDVSNPSTPQTLVAALTLGNDPTPAQIRLGRIAFSTARGSTNGTFACASCHPNGNIDQLLWMINTVNGPDDGPDPDGNLSEPRTTMPIRGLRDSLPLHWEGVLSDPFPGVNANAAAFDTAPDCDLATDGEIGCARHLVNAALSGPMCQHNTPNGCEPGEGQTGPQGSNLPGTLTDEERDAMAAFQLAVAFPPGPARRPTDTLSPAANGGVSDFFTNEDLQGINTGIGQVVSFAPSTCADNPMGCHSLPITVSTNSSVVGGFDAPSARGMWDRNVLFSNGIVSTEETLRMAQDCADGIEPPVKTVFVNLGGDVPLPIPIYGDPCNLRSPALSQAFGFQFASLPFPSGEHVYDPAEGLTERGVFVATFEGLFALVYGVRGDRIWQYQVELSTGLPGLLGRQMTVDAGNAQSPEVVAFIAMLEDAARVGKITAVATSATYGELRYVPASGNWTSLNGLFSFTSEKFRQQLAATNKIVTFIADLPGKVTIGGADRQPLLDVDPDLRAVEVNGDEPSIPRPDQNQVATFRLGARYVEPGARVLVNGSHCETCSFAPAVANNGESAIDMTLDPGLPAGVHVVQVLNPEGQASNEMPICVNDGVSICCVTNGVDVCGGGSVATASAQ
jgi:YVTN family beta-propeller protein